MNKIKRSDKFSPIFNIAINSDLLKLNVFGTGRGDIIATKLMALKERYQNILLNEMKSTEKRISDYREMESKKFSDLKERGEYEYNILVSLISQAPDESTNKINNNLNNNLNIKQTTTIASDVTLSPKITHLDTPPTTPDSAPIESSPPFKQQKTIWPSSGIKIGTTTSSLNDSTNNIKLSSSVTSQSSTSWIPIYPAKSSNDIIKSADSDCLFDLDDDINDYDSNDNNRDKMMDDYDDDEDENEVINPIRQYTKQTSINLAKSLPISMPIIGFRNIEHEIDDDDNKTDDNVDIAASIKALAKSVHGDTVFGDLPRPRFSTQI